MIMDFSRFFNPVPEIGPRVLPFPNPEENDNMDGST
jgi:hypothetical protein